MRAILLRYTDALGRFAGALGLFVLIAGCGPELDPISRVETLRIIGVQKSAPFARPGERVELTMLWEDTREDAPEVESFFAFWCVNPAGDLFSECLTQTVDPDFEPQFVSNSSSFTIDIPENSLRPSTAGPSAPQSGSAIVFYGVCAGHLDGAVIENNEINTEVLEGASDGQELIPRCLDENGNDAGPDDFVVGYSTILLYEELRNENPLITGFQVDGEDVQIDCVDTDCDAPFAVPALEGCEEGVACINACKDDGDPALCPEINITALVNEDSAESDEFAKLAYGTELEESIWISYFVDRGNVSAPVILVNDAILGWQDDFSTGVLAPKDKGPLRLWAAVRDNRGGISWIRVPAYVK